MRLRSADKPPSENGLASRRPAASGPEAKSSDEGKTKRPRKRAAGRSAVDTDAGSVPNKPAANKRKGKAVSRVQTEYTTQQQSLQCELNNGQVLGVLETEDQVASHHHNQGSMSTNHVQNPDMTDVTQNPRIRPQMKPHSKYVIAGLQIASVLLLVLYLVLPAVIKLYPSIVAEIAFLNRVRWPPFVNLSNPEEFGLNYTRAFRLDTDEGITVGVWHILPTTLHGDHAADQDYEKLLSNGSPVILYLHGNAGTRGGWHRVQIYKRLSEAGFHVVTLDYRGYADSTGSPSEEGLSADGFAMYKWIKQRSGKVATFVWGHSMGSGVATKVAKRIGDEGHHLDALFLESPFNNIIEAATRHPFSQPFKFLPWFTWGFLEAMKYNKIVFRSDATIAKVTVPTLIMHAEDDGIVPYELGRKLYETALSTKEEGRVMMVTFDGSHGYGHKHIHKSPELAHIVWDFIEDKQCKIFY